MPVSSRARATGQVSDQHIHVQQGKFPSVDHIKYLGITVDSHLTWSQHIQELCAKLSSKIGMLKRLKHLLPIDCLVRVYNAVVQPHIDYCLTVWGGAASVYIDRVQRLQNKAARIITGVYDRDVNGVSLVKRLGWQNVRERCNYLTCLLVFKSTHGLAPLYMQDMFTFSSALIGRPTRSHHENNLYVPMPNLEMYRTSLQYRGACLWNSLPVNIKSAPTLASFKARYRLHFK